MYSSTIRRKIERLRKGAKLRALDLFSGCGGISLGFKAAGFDIVAGVEFDKDAATTHGINFHVGDPAHSEPRDITTTGPEELCEVLELGHCSTAVDVIVGGPPCQAFARVGRPKLREINDHPEAFLRDPRSRLYLQYLRYVDAFQPLALLMENVPDVLNHGGQNIAEEICEVLRAKGYLCGYTLLNSAFYGVPQMRERMFLVAYRKEVAGVVSFPKPRNWLVLPSGYDGSRAVALKLLRGSPLFSDHSFVVPPRPTAQLPPAVTAQEAIGDLPPIYAIEQLANGTLSRGIRKFDRVLQSDSRRSISAFAKRMREWPGYRVHPEGYSDHVIRYLPRDYAIFARMQAGEQYPEAHGHALRILQEALDRMASAGELCDEGSKRYNDLCRMIVPPYDVSKFPNKWRKMAADQPARTLMAHLGKDSYSHIHYDSDQARTISVREAARLQSFPDGFRFSGAMNSAFRQIGNAVPPLLAKALASHIRQALLNG